MTAIEYILKNQSINFKYLFKHLRENLFTLILIAFIIFIISSFFSYRNLVTKINIKIYFGSERNIEIVNNRKVLQYNNTLKQFMNNFLQDFYISYKFDLLKNNNKKYEIIESDYDADGQYFYFFIDLNSLEIPSNEILSSIQKEFKSNFNTSLYKEAKKYSSASDIDYKILNKSIYLREVELEKPDKKNLILLFISSFFTSLIISILFILFKKIR